MQKTASPIVAEDLLIDGDSDRKDKSLHIKHLPADLESICAYVGLTCTHKLSLHGDIKVAGSTALNWMMKLYCNFF